MDLLVVSAHAEGLVEVLQRSVQMAQTVVAETLVVERDVVFAHSDHRLIVVLQRVLIVPDPVVEPALYDKSGNESCPR